MIRLPKLLRFTQLSSILLLLALLSPAFAAEFKPAPQEFRQEVSRRWTGASANGFTLVDLAPDGTVLLCDGNQWHALRNDRCEVLPPPKEAREGDGWIFIGGIARAVPTPLSGIRQIHRQRDVAWLATAKGVVLVSATGSASSELLDHDVR